MDSLLEVGVSGLTAARLALQTAGNNIANVNTPGYSRQSVLQTSQRANFSGSLYLGAGTAVQSVQRAYNEFAVAQQRDLESQVAKSALVSSQLGSITGMLGTENSGVAPAMSQVFANLQALSANPSDTATRTTALAGAATFVHMMQSTSQQLTDERTSLNQQLGSLAAEVNSFAAQVASLNNQIAVATSAGGSPNDLLDQRDQVVQQLSQDIRVSALKTSGGDVSLYLGSGQPLVVGGTSYALSSQSDPALPTDQRLVLQNSAGRPVPVSLAGVGGGKLAGVIEVRDGALNAAQNALGHITAVLATALNEQQALGVDAGGRPGQPMFTLPGPQVIARGDNQGGGALSASFSDTTALTGSDYQVVYDGSQYSVRRLSDSSTTFFGSMPQTLDGVTIASSGTPAAGDSFLVRPTIGVVAGLALAISNPNQIAAGGALVASAPLSNKGAATIAQPVVDGYPADPALRDPVTIRFTSATTYTLTTPTGTSAPQTFAPGGSIAINGWSVQVNGAAAAGDTFAIGPNTNPGGDSRNAVAMAALQSLSLVDGATLAGALGGVVSSTASQQQASQTALGVQQSMLTTAKNDVQSAAGVNLDEEASNLLTLQQAYQASSKYIQIADSLFQGLMQLNL
jgi:flagellar hook-associated protein 1 FlgK